MSDESLEAPEADAAEQDTDALSEPNELGQEPAGVPLEANPADAAEQAREVPEDEDESYR